MGRPSVFIGSSSEGLKVAQHIKQQLAHDAEVTIWHEGVFGLNKGTLEGLLDALGRFEFAILVLTPDDLSESRKSSSQAPRDNVLFECGLFLGRLGRDRTFIVFDRDKELKIPSDLAGVTLASYKGNRRDKNLLAAVEEACFKIRNRIDETLQREPDLSLYTEYKLGRKTYRETLDLFEAEDHSILGSRRLKSSDTDTVFRVQGFAIRGFYFLEYHTEDRRGGGTIALRDISAGKHQGVIVAPHCDNAVLRCYVNKWIQAAESETYRRKWQQRIGQVNSEGTVDRAPDDRE